MRVQNIARFITNRWVLLTIGLWVVMVTVAVVTFLWFHKIEELKTEAKGIAQEIDRLTAKQENLTNSVARLNLEDKHLSEILSDLLAASKKSGARLGETTVAETVVNGDFSMLPVSVSVLGTYNQIGTFMNAIEQSQRFKIVELDMSTKDTKNTGIRCTIKAEYIVL